MSIICLTDSSRTFRSFPRRGKTPRLRTNGANTNGAAAAENYFARLGKRYTLIFLGNTHLTGVPSVRRHVACSDPISVDPSCPFPDAVVVPTDDAEAGDRQGLRGAFCVLMDNTNERYIHACIHIYVYIYIYTCMYVYVCMYVYMYVYIYMCVCIYIYMSVCIYIYIYTYMYTYTYMLCLDVSVVNCVLVTWIIVHRHAYVLVCSLASPAPWRSPPP